MLSEIPELHAESKVDHKKDKDLLDFNNAGY